MKKENYFVWLLKQLKGWPIQNYLLWWFALGFQLALLIGSPITTVAVITFIGTLLGTLCVLSINAAKSVNGWLGLISAACFIYAGWTAKNYLSIFEQIAYIATLDLPVLLSVKSWNSDTVNHLRKFGLKQWIVSIILTVIVYVISSYAIGALTPDPRPWIDGLSFAVSLTAGVICFLRYNNQYFWWLFSGIFQLILWGITFVQGDATIAMAVNSLIYVANDVLAFTVSPWFNHGRRKMELKEIKKNGVEAGNGNEQGY
ncbi:nicotinamide riboside transporter PnuC [Ligilactobacillus acidipiscis]|uniref:nicotinamide riboside transporter PnuC n=1 Tax=Ligilactobacillus acidipiscis TaxID=89059 RepID=UPI0023F9045A|nr:nicotinamide riboside transporter PnuC [Ligilactobacillus acidipiscis]WEV56147.1 nicotinamide riboside transporter PnuC [Ligilactobacillus acidipiscis]